MTDYNLTPKEHAVLKELLEGKSNREIMTALDLSLRAVQGRIVKIAIKYGVKKRTEIIAKHSGVN